MVYLFQCDLFDAGYDGYTARHLHQRIAEQIDLPRLANILKMLTGMETYILNENQFSVLRKCRSKFGCLVYEMLYVKDRCPISNIQSDSIRANYLTRYFYCFTSVFKPEHALILIDLIVTF